MIIEPMSLVASFIFILFCIEKCNKKCELHTYVTSLEEAHP